MSGYVVSRSKQPSLSCWLRQAASSRTTLTSTGSRKSATGGSLNARWPFSPIPAQTMSDGSALRSPVSETRPQRPVDLLARDQPESVWPPGPPAGSRCSCR